jgi:hypothetical protein
MTGQVHGWAAHAVLDRPHGSPAFWIYIGMDSGIKSLSGPFFRKQDSQTVFRGTMWICYLLLNYAYAFNQLMRSFLII